MRQQSIERELSTELMVGTFMLMVLLALAYFTIVLGKASFFKQRYPFEVEFRDVMGLRKDDNVVLRGMTIGRISALQLVRDRVRVSALLDSPVELKKDYRIVIISTSILGGRYLEIKEGTPEAGRLAAEIMPQGELPFDLMAEAAAAIHDIRGAMNEGGVLTNLEQAVASIREIAGKINAGQGTLGKLVNDDSAYTDLQAIMKDVRVVAEQFKGVSEKLGKGEGTLGKLLADDSIYKDVQAVTANLKDVSQRLADGQGSLGKLLSADDTLYKDISATAASLKAVTAKIERGEGLLGRLIQDDSLYTEAKSAVREVRAAVDDFRETSPVVSFTSLLFGAF
jgi:phospholipid/cholesterol/gamma-HCH transport system substrate-binding protein